MSSVDRRTAKLVAALRESRRHGGFIAAVERCDPKARPALPRKLRILLVPGVLYRAHPETGADGKALFDAAASLGLGVERFDADETGRLAENVAALEAWLAEVPKGDPTLLVSLSKGSTEVWHALHAAGAARTFRGIDAWVSVSGIPLGTPSLDHLIASRVRHTVLRMLCSWKGWAPGFLSDYSASGADRFEPPSALPGLELLQVSGFPESADLRDGRSRRFHRRLAERGPNDGFALLEDLCRLPGRVYPVAGADHYLRQVEDLPGLVARILLVLGDELAKRKAA